MKLFLSIVLVAVSSFIVTVKGCDSPKCCCPEKEKNVTVLEQNNALTISYSHQTSPACEQDSTMTEIRCTVEQDQARRCEAQSGKQINVTKTDGDVTISTDDQSCVIKLHCIIDDQCSDSKSWKGYYEINAASLAKSSVGLFAITTTVALIVSAWFQ